MTSAALPPAAVLCALRRTVAGSRALRVLLLLAGLLTLGLLWGGQAHAAEAPAEFRAEAEAAADVRPGAAARADGDDPAASRAPGQETPEQAAIRAARSAANEAVRPLAGTVSDLTGALTGALPLPAPGALPDVPGGPAVVQPVTGTVPSTLLGGVLRAMAQAPAPADADATGSSAADTRSGTVTGYDGGIRPGQSPDVPVPPVPSAASAPDQAPAPFVPCGLVPGTVQHGGENHTPRPGDQHGAAFADAARDALVSGPGCPAAEPPTRDRPRDIPEFPG
ncbi:hypothetical protein ACF08N_07110 [Streptomyces sp. NPDC015127]|uniref:hypothetical protein n=1 Tax=Streptomyces sp. NPDC015127 TaxID=3364939 RepID=UPI00370163EC